MDLATLTAILGRFGTGLSQHARLITLTSAHDVTLPDAPLAERVRGREAVNETYRFDVDALSTSTDLDLAGFIGEELTTTLLQPDGTRRAWHGICTAAEWLGADGGVARYRLRLEPALALLRLRRDSYIFQNKNVEGIVSELFGDYPQLRFEFDVTQDMPARAICTQYRECDYDFFVRLMASEGLSWRFEHDQGDVADDGQARHRLVIFDGAASFPETPGNPVIRFHGMRATDSDDAIDAFRARRRVQANAVSISSWMPGQLVAPAAEQEPYLDAGEVPVARVYDGAGERIATDSGAAERLSRLMLQALELDNKLFEGEGAVRRLAAGHAFALTQHDRYPIGENAFKVLWVEHEARNNVDARIATANAGGIEPGTYRNRFGCVRSVVPVIPRATALPNPHTALGPQTALVVGLPDSVATTTRDHQVRVQFAWQRGAGGNPGSPYHDTDADGCAPGDDRSGTWVRVAEALAGPNWGSQFTPRVGTEVLVDFIENDIDRPLVVAQLYTGPDAPPFAAGVDSGVDHAGTISGIHTQTFDGAGWNQWQLDDTPGQLRMRLATSMAATQLNLGHLVHQPAGSARRGTYRGSGFELRTDAWAVVRGGDGVLLTTSTRQALGAGVASTQMDAAEAVDSLKAAQTLDKVLRDSAKAQNALSSAAAAQAQQEFIAQIDPTAQGKFAGPVNGHDATKAKSGSRELDAGAPVERFGKPVVLMDSQAGMNWATPASTVLFAGQQLHWTTQADMHMTAAYTLSSVSAEATTLYSDQGGIQAIAANGPVSLQAHTDQLEILADKEVSVISVNDGIEVKAAKKIVLQAGQASVTLEGGDITFACPGTFSVKGAQHPFEGGARAGATSEALPGELIGASSLFNALGNALGSSLAKQQRFAGMDARVDEVMGDVLANGERLAALNAPAREMPLDDENARALGADSEGRVVVVGKRPPSWLNENVVRPVEHALSETGEFLKGAAHGVGDGLSNLLAKPSNSTDEIPQHWPTETSSAYARGIAGRILSEGPSNGPMLVPIDPIAEARDAEKAARAATNIGILAGGPIFTGYAAGAQVLGAPNDIVNNLGISQTGVIGAVAAGPGSQAIYTGPKSFPQQFGIRYEPPAAAERLFSQPPAPRVDISDEFILKPAKGGGIFLRYGNPEVHGLEVFVDKQGVLGFDIRSAPGGTSWSNASGTDMFSSAMLRLKTENIEVNAIRGTWLEGTDSVNTAQYLENVSTMTPQEAAANTWTGRLAARYGYTNVSEPKTSFGTTTVLFGK